MNNSEENCTFWKLLLKNIWFCCLLLLSLWHTLLMEGTCAYLCICHLNFSFMVLWFSLFSDKISYSLFAAGRREIDMYLHLLVSVCYPAGYNFKTSFKWTTYKFVLTFSFKKKTTFCLTTIVSDYRLSSAYYLFYIIY